MALLHPGDTFPDLDVDVDLVGGESLLIPEVLSGNFAVVIFKRGSWCPFCNAQLRGFQRAQADLDDLGARVVSLSVDDEETTSALVEKHKFCFPVGHSADAPKISGITGAFVNPDPVYLQATGFVLDPEGKVVVRSYSSGAIGRLTAEDTVGVIRHVKQSQEAPPPTASTPSPR